MDTPTTMPTHTWVSNFASQTKIKLGSNFNYQQIQHINQVMTVTKIKRTILTSPNTNHQQIRKNIRNFKSVRVSLILKSCQKIPPVFVSFNSVWISKSQCLCTQNLPENSHSQKPKNKNDSKFRYTHTHQSTQNYSGNGAWKPNWKQNKLKNPTFIIGSLLSVCCVPTPLTSNKTHHAPLWAPLSWR